MINTTAICMFCRGPHTFRNCPLLAPTKTYLNAFAPPPPLITPQETRARVSLAPTLFEQLFGPGAEVLLQEVPDRPESYTSDEIELAWQILSGAKQIKGLQPDERDILDAITHRMAGVAPVKQPAKQTERRLEDDEGPPRDATEYENLVTRGQIDPSDG